MAKNPSPLLPIGQIGQLAGQTYTVAGRIEMAMEDAGVTYGWSEFHLVAPDGSWATLVQEEGERGVEWRLFRLITPTTPMSASEASTKQVGNHVDLTGESLRVTLVGQSRVVRIEGQAPEGIEEGDVAQYFNAESGNQMLVVSWTGQEVDVYRGIQLPTHAVYRAFGLQPPPIPVTAVTASTPTRSGARKILITIVLVLTGLGVVNGRRWGCARTPGPRSDPNLLAPSIQLKPGSTGAHDGATYRVVGREQVEIKRVGSAEIRQEYQLRDESGAVILLQQLPASLGGRWYWLKPATFSPGLRPTDAATNRLGDVMTIDGESVRVTELFMSSVQATDGTNSATTGTRWYGFEARGAARRIWVRWNEATLSAHWLSPATAGERASFGLR